MLVFVINRLFICVLRTIEEEKEKSKKELGDELTAQQAEWQQEMEQRLRAEVLEQMQVEQQLLRERQSRVELREQGLASLAEQLTAVHDDINQRLSQLSVSRTSSFFIHTRVYFLIAVQVYPLRFTYYRAGTCVGCVASVLKLSLAYH